MVLQEELKAKEQSFATERRQLSLARRGQEEERLAEQLKDKDETIVRLQIELQSLQVSHFNVLMKTGLNGFSCFTLHIQRRGIIGCAMWNSFV